MKYTLVSNTPIVKIKRLTNINAFMKLEFMNLGGSIKFRVAYEMINDLAKKVTLKNKVILEASGGNTAIGLAILSKVYGYRLKCVIPDNYPKSKIKQLKFYDIDVILSDHKKGLNSHILKAREIASKNPDYIYIDQFSNYSNIKAHYFGTAGEVVNCFKKVDYFLTGIGSGGTITGVGKRLKEEYNSTIIGVLPKGYDINGKTHIEHNIPGIAIGIKSKVLDTKIIDKYIYVDNNDLKEAYYLAKEEGLFVGISSLANIASLIKLNNSLKKNSTVITIAQDRINDYFNYIERVVNA